MSPPEEVALLLRQALKMFLSEMEVSQVPPANWPSSFKLFDENISWPYPSIRCVIQKPSGEHCMLIAAYESGVSDISLSYISGSKVFFTLARACPSENDPFSQLAISKLEKLKRSVEWRGIVQRLNEL